MTVEDRDEHGHGDRDDHDDGCRLERVGHGHREDRQTPEHDAHLAPAGGQRAGRQRRTAGHEGHRVEVGVGHGHPRARRDEHEGGELGRERGTAAGHPGDEVVHGIQRHGDADGTEPDEHLVGGQPELAGDRVTPLVDREERQVVGVEREVVDAPVRQRAPRVERAREVHDDPGIPAVGVLPGQPDGGRDDAAHHGDGGRHPADVRASAAGARRGRAPRAPRPRRATTGQRKGVMTGRGATSATTATASSPTPVSRNSARPTAESMRRRYPSPVCARDRRLRRRGPSG